MITEKHFKIKHEVPYCDDCAKTLSFPILNIKKIKVCGFCFTKKECNDFSEITPIKIKL